ECLLVDFADARAGKILNDFQAVELCISCDLAALDRALDRDIHDRQRDFSSRLGDHDGEWAFAPLSIGYRDHGCLGDALGACDKFLTLDRVDPLAAGLYDVFQSVADANAAFRIDGCYVLRVHPAAAPQALRSLGIARVAGGEPGRSQDQLTACAAIV